MTTSLLRNLAYRLALLVPLLLGVSVLTFLLVRLGDKSPAALMAGPTATQAEIEGIEADMGHDRPLLTQKWINMKGLFTGDLGDSWQSGRPVLDELLERLPITLEMVTYGMICAIVIGVLLGVWSAVRQGSIADHVLRVVTLVGLSVPIFWLGLILIVVLFSQLGIAPAPFQRVDRTVELPSTITGFLVIDSVVTGHWAAAASAASYLVLPVLTIGIIGGTEIAKQVRSEMVEVLSGPAVKYARASGLPERKVVGLAFRNAFPNLIAYLGITFSLSLGGSALVELVFSWPGMGKWGVDAIVGADFAVVQAYVLCVGIVTSLIYLACDLLLVACDPRVRLTK